jgi:hypothetical protein
MPPSSRQPEIHDLVPRLALSPIFGILIPNLAGLIDNGRHSTASLVGSYLYFTATALAIWEGNRQLYFRLPWRDEWLRHPLRRIALLLAAIAVYTIPITLGLLWLWRAVTGDPGTREHAVLVAVLACVAAVAIVTHAYETVFLLHDWESDRLRSARLEQQRLEAELESLRREADPHFLFNSLNVLAHLVEQNSVRAPPFIQALSATYRYLLDVRGRPLVPLAEEIGALERHLLLTNIRYGGAIVLTVDVPADAAQGFSLPPVTLSELLQNAVKHNELSQDSPLSIGLHLEDDTLVFGNELRRRGLTQGSTGVGLRNLSGRFTLAVGRDLEWREAGNRFEVRLPLVRTPSSSSALPRTIAGVLLAVVRL